MGSFELYDRNTCRQRMQCTNIVIFPQKNWTLWLWFFFFTKAMWTFAITWRLSSVVYKYCDHKVHAQHGNISARHVIISMFYLCLWVRCSNQFWLISNGRESAVDFLTVCESRFEALDTSCAHNWVFLMGCGPVEL